MQAVTCIGGNIFEAAYQSRKELTHWLTAWAAAVWAAYLASFLNSSKTN